MPEVVKDAVGARMENAGQACNAAKRFIVAEPPVRRVRRPLRRRRWPKLTTGDPTDPTTSYGPLSSEAAAAGLMAQVQDAIDKGATVRTGGRRIDGPGAFVEPTVLTDVTPEMRAYREELFGPVAVIYKVSDADEAVALANDSPFGLGGAVYHTDPASRSTSPTGSTPAWCGSTSPRVAAPSCPFGGTKRSGVGRELGPYGIDEFVNRKLIHAPAG